jgi:hypothetical protein
MSDTATSGEAPVAPAETVSAPPAPVANTTAQAAPAASFPTFGNSRGSGLARGKRASTPATTSNSSNTTPAASGEYTPTAIQIITTEREYKNPFAPEPAPEPIAAPAPAAPVVAAATAAVEQPAAAVVAPEVTPAASPAPRAEIEHAIEPAPTSVESAPAASEPAEKAELKILPPENKVRPAQSWESSSFPSGGQQSNNPNAGGNRGGDRPIFRTERHRQRDAEAAQNAPASSGDAAPRSDEPQPFQRRDFREQRQPRDPRDQREPRQPRDPRDAREPRQPRDPRDSRGFNKPQSGTTPPVSHTSSVDEKKSGGGLISWIKGLFSGEPAAPEKPADQSGKPAGGGERRFDRDGRGGGGGRRNHRGGRGGQGNRGQGGQGGGFRGENRGGGEGQPRTDGQPGGEHRGQGGGGGFRGERRGGEGRSDTGGSSGPAAS